MSELERGIVTSSVGLVFSTMVKAAVSPAWVVLNPLLVGVTTMAGTCSSKAPMSEPSPPRIICMAGSSWGRDTPRWSVVAPKVLPLSMAGLPS